MNTPLPDPDHMPRDEFLARAEQLARFIADYTDTIESRPPLPPTEPGDVFNALPEHPPEHHQPFDDILRDVEHLITPNIAHWQHPGWFAFFSANTSYPALLADFLSTGLAAQGMLWKTSPALTEVETRTLDWLAELLDLPPHFRSTHTDEHNRTGGGVIQSTASEATLVALTAARHAAAERLVAQGKSPHDLRPIIYTSTQAHSSVVKAAMIAGLAHTPDDDTFVRRIPTRPDLSLDPAALQRAIDQDLAAGLHPTYLCATLGTTATGAFDPLAELGPIAHKHNLWLHVDAAWAGSALVFPEHRAFATGLHHADSVCINPHKWLLTTFDCDAFYVRDRAALTRALSIAPEYLRNDATDRGVIDYRDWQIPLGRRFRALKLLFVIRWYGAEGLRAHIRHHVALAEHLEHSLRADPRLDVPLPRALALTCFRVHPDAAAKANTTPDAATRQLLDRLNATNRHYLTHAAVPLPADPSRDHTIIRVNIGTVTTEQRHVDALLKDIADITSALLTPTA